MRARLAGRMVVPLASCLALAGCVSDPVTGDRRFSVVDWTPDGKEVVYRTAIEATGRPITKLYAVTTEGHEPRQHERPASGGPQESLAKGPAGAPGRQ